MILKINNNAAGNLKITADTTAGLYITRAALNQAQSDFILRYSTQSGSNFVDEFSVDWNQFWTQINSCVGQQGITTDNLILRLIHRYNAPNWYLTAQCCIMAADGQSNNGITQYNVTDTEFFFKLYDTTAVSTDTDPGYYANDYFSALYYSPDGETQPVNLKTDDPDHEKYVGNVLFAWKKEILQLGIDNNICDATGKQNIQGTVCLKFASCSFDYQGTPSQDASIEWPHGIVMYLNVNGRDLLLNDSSVLKFTNLGADLANLCPPNCSSVYIMDVIGASLIAS